LNQGEHLFDELKRYVDFGREDEVALRGILPRALPHIPAIAEDFYAHILDHREASKSITGGAQQVERLKGTLRTWMEGIFQGPWDDAYFERRARIGRRHVQIDLPQQYMFTAMNVIRGHMTDVILDTAADRNQVRRELHALDKILDMELAIMLHTYREDYLVRMQQTERLATFGQLVASIGHELRNPLGVIESSLFLLRGRVPADEKVVRHLDRIEAQVRTSNRIISDMLDIVRELPAQRRPVPLPHIVKAVLDTTPPPENVSLAVDLGKGLPEVAVDPDQLRQVFGNLLENAYQAAGEGGEVRMLARTTDDGMVEIVVNDSGPGIDPAIRNRLFEPLVTTKVKGVGLGLSLSRRILERNEGTITLGQGPLPGAAFVVRLPLHTEP